VPEDLDLIVKMEGDLTRIYCQLNPKFAIEEKGALYLKCLKALYGHIEAARSFYNKLDYSLTERVFFMRNKYDPCVYNHCP
jgi:hypothetical protein